MANKQNTKKEPVSSIDWKSLAIQRRLENKELLKRIKEIVEGREKWKQKAYAHRLSAEAYKKEIDQIKKKLAKIMEN